MLARMTRPYVRSLVFLVALGACTTPPADGDAGEPGDASANDTGVAMDAAIPYPSYCENISGVNCLLPFPSSRFLVDDATTVTHRRVAFPMEGMPINASHHVLDPHIFNRFDGFSPATSLVTAFTGGDLDEANLADEVHIGDSILDTSPTLLFEVHGTTLTRVAHFAESDHWVRADPERRPLFIRPAARMTPNTRYIVAIRDLHHPGGTPVEPNPYFRALRDATPLAEAADIESRRAGFEDVFGLLTAAGVDRTHLIQAWDFWTASDESLYTDLVSVRDQGLAALSTLGTSCTVTSMHEGADTGDAHVFRRVYGTVRVPLFLHGIDPNHDDQCLLERDAAGHVIQNPTTPTTDVPFTISIPVSTQTSLMADGEPARLLEYGHGLFGSQDESESGWLGEFADARGFVVVAVDWWGMSEFDLPRAAGAIGELSRMPTITERYAQGILNFLAIVRSLIVSGQCQSLPELHVNGHLVFDPAERYYHGNSQGGIMGTTVAAVSTDITRFGLGVAGAGYSLLIPRSVDGVTYVNQMYNAYRHDAVVTSLNWVMSQAQWDLTEPTTYVPHLRAHTLPCSLPECTGGLTPVHHVAYQIGRDDTQVPNLGAAFAARSMVDDMGHMLPLMSDATHVSPFIPYGLPTTSGPVESALTIFLTPTVVPLPIGARQPAPDNEVHERVRRSMGAQEQLDRFFHADGMVEQTCPGTCEAPL
jgi:hypothetical protein